MGPLADIVDRLRLMAKWEERRQRRSYLLQSAADEIERLRAEVETLTATVAERDATLEVAREEFRKLNRRQTA